MSDSPLLAYINDPDSYSTAITKGYKPGLTADAVKETGPLDIPFLLKLATKSPAPAEEQTEYVDRLAAVTTRPTAVCIGTEPANFTTSVSRAPVSNYMQKIQDVFSVSEESEWIAKNGGIAGAVVSEVRYDIRRKSKSLLTGAELTMWTKQPGQLDTRVGTTPGYIKGVFTLVTTNDNVKRAADGTSEAFVPTNITDVTETHLRDMIGILFDYGCDFQLTGYVPTVLHEAWSANFQGRPGVRITAKQDETLSMEIEHYRAVSGVDLEIIPDRTMSKYCAGIIDHKQFSKRIMFPFEVRMFAEPWRNKHGYMQYKWTILPGIEGCSGGWYTTSLPTTNVS